MFVYKKIILDNGLRLFVSPVKATRVVSVNVFVKIGSRYETIDNNGITHFIEHMLFKGTGKRRDMLSISKEIEGVGGHINAAVAQEYSHFYVSLLDKHLERALDVLSDILLNSRFDKSDIEIEKNTILEEIKMHKDHPGYYVREVFNNLLYGKQPLGFPIAGEKKVLKRISRGNIVDYWHKNFLSANTIISIAGNIDIEKTRLLVNKYFGGVRKGNALEFIPAKEAQKELAVSLYYKETEQTHLCIGNRAYKYTHPDFYTLEVLDVILGATISSRLFTILRAQKGLVYSVGSGNNFFDETGNLVVDAGVGHKNVEETIKIILNEFDRLKNEDVEKEELERAKNYIVGSLYMALDSSSGVANYVGSHELHLGKVVLPAELTKKVKKVTAKDVRRVANDIFSKNNLNLALVGPFKKKKKFKKILEER